jgi:membrane protease YdiL (CAAX protease family)
VFAISWGCITIILGPGGFLGTTQTAEVQLFLGGPIALLGPSVAGVLLTGLTYGKAGFRELVSRLFSWRVGVRWYAVALLTAPLLTTAIIYALSLTPVIITTEDKASLLLLGIAVGLLIPFCEELGWTGFAIPELRKRYGILATGLIVGLLWGAWHFPLFSASVISSGAFPPAVLLAVLLFSWLPPYRVVMVWVYDRTKSLLVVILMHMPIVVDEFVLLPQGISVGSLVTYDLLFAAALWALVAAIVAVRRREQEPTAQAAPQTGVLKEEHLSPLAVEEQRTTDLE